MRKRCIFLFPPKSSRKGNSREQLFFSPVSLSLSPTAPPWPYTSQGPYGVWPLGCWKMVPCGQAKLAGRKAGEEIATESPRGDICFPKQLALGSQCFLRVSGLSGMLCPPSWACLLYDAVSASCLRSCFAPCPPAGKVENCLGSISWCLLVIWFMKIVWAQAIFLVAKKRMHAHFQGRLSATRLPSLVSSLVVLIVGLLTVLHSLRDIQTSIRPIGTLRQTFNLVQESNKIREEQGQQENNEEGGEIREIEGAENQSRLERAENQSRLEVKPKAPLEHLQSSQRFRQLIWSAEEAIGGLPQACSNHQGRGRIEKLTNGVAHSDMICQPEMDGHRDEGKDGILGAGSLACYSLTSAGRSMHYLCQGKNWLGQSTVKREGLAWGLSFSALCKWSQGVSVPLPFYIEGNKGNKELMDFTPLREKKPCDQWIEETTFIFRPREDVGRNPWHAHEEFLTLFASVAALDLQEYRMLINRPSRDPQKLYPPYELHRTLFSPTKLWHSDDFRGTVCFSRVVIPLPPERAPHTKKPLPNCVLNPWILGYRMHLASTYGLTDLWHHGTASPLSVLLISRKGSFKRQISNEQELLVALRAETVSARALVMDQTSSLTEQLKAVAASQLLIGAHGAALFWLIVLPLCGAVFEFGTGADHHYQMLASYVGIRHRYVGPGFSHGSPRIVADVKATINQLKKERVQLQQCSVDLPQ